MNETPLSQLRDIHLPQAVSAWPPAWGWWLVAILILILIATLVWYCYRRYQQSRSLRLALKQLKQVQDLYRQSGDVRQYIRDLNALLKYFACNQAHEKSAAQLTGEDWLSYLDRTGTTDAFTRGNGRWLGEAAYRPDDQIEVNELDVHCQQWLRRQLG